MSLEELDYDSWYESDRWLAQCERGHPAPSAPFSRVSMAIRKRSSLAGVQLFLVFDN